MRHTLSIVPVLGLLLFPCCEHHEERELPPPLAAMEQEPGDKVEVPPPEFEDGIFPCTDCHDPEIGYNATRRELKMVHSEIELRHDEEHRWCLDCHDAENRDMLRLASGQLVEFTESYLLCGQCHGDKYRDWRAGAHGRRSGEWNGVKTYLLCVHCHNSHAPAFGKLDPRPAPVPPRGNLR
jgi:hypothetical protein